MAWVDARWICHINGAARKCTVWSVVWRREHWRAASATPGVDRVRVRTPQRSHGSSSCYSESVMAPVVESHDFYESTKTLKAVPVGCRGTQR